MSSPLLTDAERLRFAEYLERSAASSQGIVEQMKTLGPAFSLAAGRYEAEIAAELLIARKLRMTTSESIG